MNLFSKNRISTKKISRSKGFIPFQWMPELKPYSLISNRYATNMDKTGIDKLSNVLKAVHSSNRYSLRGNTRLLRFSIVYPFTLSFIMP